MTGSPSLPIRTHSPAAGQAENGKAGGKQPSGKGTPRSPLRSFSEAIRKAAAKAAALPGASQLICLPRKTLSPQSAAWVAATALAFKLRQMQMVALERLGRRSRREQAA